MAESVIGYKLDLAVRLIDTTTGRLIPEKQVTFSIDGKAAILQECMTGVYVSFHQGNDIKWQKDMELEVTVKGYRATKTNVECERLSEPYPTVEIPLIPEDRKSGYSNVITLAGVMEGIKDIEAVSLHASLAEVVSYHTKKQTVKLLYAGAFDEERYAVLHEQQNAFEAFRIDGRKDGLILRLQNPLQMDCSTGERIARIVKGCVDRNGRYLLSVRGDGFGTAYLVKYTVKGDVKFKRISFDNPAERRLE